jgi:transglutaminase-like putative cysteine protease
MKLQVFHRTRFDYAAPVRDSFNEARLQPLTADGQVCRQFLLKIMPPTRLSHYTDFQRNTVHMFDVVEPHRSLAVDAMSVVATTSSMVLAPDLVTTALTAMENCSQMDACHDFLQSSRYVEADIDVWKLALDITAGVSDTWHAAQALMHHIHREFAYTPAATTVHTHMRDVLRLRCGVCQDFAHVMIGLCRALKIPARYVSGYLYNGPVDQLRGAQASHAWVDVFLPGLGWHGLDPTNGCQSDERYVKVAVGRDYADVSPLRGRYHGTSERKLTVEVLVTALEAVGSEAAR